MFRFLFRTLLPALALAACLRAVMLPFWIPSGSMEPTLRVHDVVLTERVSQYLGRPIHRGDILCFYVPPIGEGKHEGQALPNDFVSKAARFAGLVTYTPEPVFIKRVVGLPGDRISIKAGVGVYVNGTLLDEPWVKGPPNYDLKLLKDIGGYVSRTQAIAPFADSKSEVVVPPGQLFMMGDNHANSMDSHVWGFLDESRVVGRTFFSFRLY